MRSPNKLYYNIQHNKVNDINIPLTSNGLGHNSESHQHLKEKLISQSISIQILRLVIIVNIFNNLTSIHQTPSTYQQKQKQKLQNSQ